MAVTKHREKPLKGGRRGSLWSGGRCDYHGREGTPSAVHLQSGRWMQVYPQAVLFLLSLGTQPNGRLTFTHTQSVFPWWLAVKTNHHSLVAVTRCSQHLVSLLLPFFFQWAQLPPQEGLFSSFWATLSPVVQRLPCEQRVAWDEEVLASRPFLHPSLCSHLLSRTNDSQRALPFVGSQCGLALIYIAFEKQSRRELSDHPSQGEKCAVL